MRPGLLAFLLLAGCGGSEASAPNDYFPLKVGAAWGYSVGLKSFGMGAYSGEAQLRCTGRQGDAWVLEWVQIITYDEGPGAPTTDKYLVSTSASSVHVQRSPNYGLWVVPADFTQGTRTFEIKTEGETFEVESTVSGEEEISTKEGTFKAVKVVSVRSAKNSRSTCKAWYAKGVGPVRMEMDLEISAAGQNQRLVNDALLERLVR